MVDKSHLLYGGSDLSPVVDYTEEEWTDWSQTELAMAADGGDSTESTWLVRDEAGVIPDRRGGPQLGAHNVVITTVGSNTLFRGRVEYQDRKRGRQFAQTGGGLTKGRAGEWTVTLSDANSHLSGIIVHDWTRPAETDVARVQALVAAYLSGNPRATTNLNGSNLVHGSNTTTLPAKTYSGVTPSTILAEIAELTDKELFVTVDNELAYFGHDYTGYASTLRISDDPANLNANTCVPIEPSRSENGRDTLTALRTYWGGTTEDDFHTFQRVDETRAAINDYWEDVNFDSDSKTWAEASQRATSIFQPRKLDQTIYTVTIGAPGTLPHATVDADGHTGWAGQPMRGDDIYKLKAGQLIEFKSHGARGGIDDDGSQIADFFLTRRIREVRWTFVGVDAYFCTLTLDRPRNAGNGKGQPAGTTPTPAPESIPNPGDTLEKFFNANDPGGDDILWPGSLGNQGGSGDGANGTDFYYYKSNSPNLYQNLWAYAAGNQLRVSGYIGCKSSGYLTLVFTDLPAGTAGSAVTAAHTTGGPYILTPTQPNHTHADEWTLFSAGPFTAPAGTTSVALGRSGGTIDFDEISIYTVVDTSADDPHAVDYGDYPHSSPHFLPSDYVEARLDEDRADIVELQENESRVLQPATNNSGVTLTAGDVVIPDTSTDGPAVTRTTTANSTAGPIGVVFEGGANGATVTVLWSGYIGFVNTNGTPADGDYLFTSTTAGAADRSATRSSGAFGRIVRDDGAGETLYCLIWGVPDSGGGSGGHSITEDGGSAFTSRSKLDFRNGLDVTDDAGSDSTRVAVDEAELTHNSLGGLTTGDPHTQYMLESLASAKGELWGASANDTPSMVAASTEGQMLVGRAAATPGNQFETINSSLVMVIGNGVNVIATGVKGYVRVPFACEIVRESILADQSGAIKIDVWVDTYANYSPTDADSITGGNEPEIAASGTKDEDATLTSWTKPLAEGSVIGINVDSCTSIKQATFELRVKRT